MLQVERTAIEGLLVLQPQVFADHRGHFFESYHHEQFEAAVGHSVQFLQDNQSLSGKNILRGLHLQHPPSSQGKLVRVVSGAVFDVAVDLRASSPTYGQHHAVELSEENHTMFWIPPGFGHGFLTLRDHTIFTYKCSHGYYDKGSEETVCWDDPDLNIAWPSDNPILSDKDRQGTPFKAFKSRF